MNANIYHNPLKTTTTTKATTAMSPINPNTMNRTTTTITEKNSYNDRTTKASYSSPPDLTLQDREELMAISRKLRRVKRKVLLKSVQQPETPLDGFRDLILRITSDANNHHHRQNTLHFPSSANHKNTMALEKENNATTNTTTSFSCRSMMNYDQQHQHY